VLAAYAAHDIERRPHRSLELRPPRPDAPVPIRLTGWASADPRRLDQSARNCGPKPLHARQRGERADAGLKNWKVLRKIRSRPNRADEQSLSMKTGPGSRGKPVLCSWRLVGGLHAAAGDERVQVERPQPRSGEDDDLDARGTGGTMTSAGQPTLMVTTCGAVAVLDVWEPRSSLYRRLEGGPGGMGGASLRWRNSFGGHVRGAGV